MTNQHSVTALIGQLEADNSQAAHELWERFLYRMIAAARKKMKNLPRRMVDEEDVVVAAFEAFMSGHKEGRFKQLHNREDLWQVLAMLIERKAIREMRYQFAEKRDARQARGESIFEKAVADSMLGGLDGIAESDPEPVDFFTQGVQEILEQIDDPVQRDIALKRLAGYTNSETAEQIGISKASVERKFSLLRDRLKERMDSELA